MSDTLNALFGQDDDSEDNAVTNDDLVYDDGQDEIVEVEASDEDAGSESDEVVDEGSPEDATDESKDESESDEDDDGENVVLTPEEERIAKVAEGRLRATQREREKRQNAERERDEMRQRLEQFERQQAAANQAQSLPDPDSDPHGYAQALHQQYERANLEQRFMMSDTMARQKYGAEKVEEAAHWATAQIQQNPDLQAQMHRQADPLGWVVEQFERQTKVDRLLNDPDALFKEWAEKNGYKPASESTPAPVVRTPVVPTKAKTAPKLAAAASIATPSKRGGSDAPSTVLGSLGLRN